MIQKSFNSALSFLHRNTHRVNEKKSLSAGFRAKCGHADGISKKSENKLERILTRTLGCTTEIAPKLDSIRNAYDELSISTSIVMRMPHNEARSSMRNLLLMFIEQTKGANFHWQWTDKPLEDKLASLKDRLLKLEPAKTGPAESARRASFSFEDGVNMAARLELAYSRCTAQAPTETSRLPSHVEHIPLPAFDRQSSEGGTSRGSSAWDDGDSDFNNEPGDSDLRSTPINAEIDPPPPSYHTAVFGPRGGLPGTHLGRASLPGR